MVIYYDMNDIRLNSKASKIRDSFMNPLFRENSLEILVLNF